MKEFSGLLAGFCQHLDRLAGLCIAGVMILVVANVLMRTAFGHPLLGTYEMAGFLTALGVGLALANCALQKGHIAVDFVMERLPLKLQAIIDGFINLLALTFWSLVAWNLVKYAQIMATSGTVSSTAQIPVYPIIYLLAVGFLGLCLVLFLDLINSVRKVLVDISLTGFPWQTEWQDYARKATR